MSLPTQLKAIIFDFDGVILESGDIKTQAFLELFADYPDHQPAILQHHLANLGVSRYDKFAWIYRELLARPLAEAERERLGCDFSAIVLDKVLRCPFVPGALDALQLLQPHYCLFVASGTPQEELEFIVRRRNLNGYFAEVWGAPCKKAEIIRGILERHGLEPEETMMVGDGLSDYEAAVATRVGFIARDTPEQQHKWCELNVSRVADLNELGLLMGMSYTSGLV
ncbi:MAG: HAD hydrolase-like protein [Chloroflexi bacterium]|nr:HAD hydrolase-like protein [Chloroflexota bacterium]MCI0644318.1 HAD hydrolase-like protein [Chloroflexota bacterium]